MKMFGSTEKFFYKDLAGIAPSSPGFRQLVIKPSVAGDLTFARASLDTVRGAAAVDWKRTDDSFEMNVIIPVNSRARVSVPKLGLENITITESGKSVWENAAYKGGVPGIGSGSQDRHYVTFDVGSGYYRFKLSGRQKTGRK
jgi:alpha-L-rhamnosidase